MLHNHRIHNIPLTVISGFCVVGFRRHGYHPRANRLIRAAHPIATRIPIVNLFYLYPELSWDDVRSAAVVIIGADGSWLRVVDYRTNQAAIDAKNSFEAQLDQFLENIQKDTV